MLPPTRQSKTGNISGTDNSLEVHAHLDLLDGGEDELAELSEDYPGQLAHRHRPGPGAGGTVRDNLEDKLTY